MCECEERRGAAREVRESVAAVPGGAGPDAAGRARAARAEPAREGEVPHVPRRLRRAAQGPHSGPLATRVRPAAAHSALRCIDPTFSFRFPY